MTEYQTATDLEAAARSCGIKVSSAQRRRFHAAGALPRPRMVGLGRGRGSEARYPRGTDDQLIRLLELLKVDRSLTHAPVQLWWEDYRVEERWVRAWLHEVLASLEPVCRERDPDNDAFWEWLSDQSRTRLTAGLGGPVRRRLGAAKFETLANLGLDALSGEVSEWTEADARVLTQALGLPDGLVPIIETAMTVIGSSLRIDRLRDRINEARDQELRAARDEIKAVWRTLAAAATLTRAVPVVGELAAGASISTTRKSPDLRRARLTLFAWRPDQAVVLCVWLELRTRDELRAAAGVLQGLHTRSHGGGTDTVES